MLVELIVMLVDPISLALAFLSLWCFAKMEVNRLIGFVCSVLCLAIFSEAILHGTQRTRTLQDSIDLIYLNLVAKFIHCSIASTIMNARLAKNKTALSKDVSLADRN